MKNLLASVALLLALWPAAVLADDSDEDDSPIADVGREHRASSGAGLTIGAGAAAALRSMEFSGSNGTIEHSPNPYLGGVVDLALDLHYFEDAEAGLRLEASGFYGTATDADADPELGRPLVAQTSELTSVVSVSRALRRAWDLRLGAGLEWSSRQVEDNDVYTGHSYFSLRFDLGVDWWNSDDSMRAWTTLQFLPTVSVTQSDGQYGDASAFGTRLAIGWGWFFFQPNDGDLRGAAELVARARACRYRAQFPSGGIVGSQAASDDDMLDLTLALRYHL